MKCDCEDKAPSERERAEFEKWASKETGYPFPLPLAKLGTDYEYQDTRFAWITWEAARREERHRCADDDLSGYSIEEKKIIKTVANDGSIKPTKPFPPMATPSSETERDGAERIGRIVQDEITALLAEHGFRHDGRHKTAEVVTNMVLLATESARREERKRWRTLAGEALLPLAALIISGECTSAESALCDDIKQQIITAHDNLLAALDEEEHAPQGTKAKA